MQLDKLVYYITLGALIVLIISLGWALIPFLVVGYLADKLIDAYLEKTAEE